MSETRRDVPRTEIDGEAEGRTWGIDPADLTRVGTPVGAAVVGTVDDGDDDFGFRFDSRVVPLGDDGG